MSLSSALSLATSGLTVSSRAAGAVSENVANALTPGYARREVEIVSGRADAASAGARVIAVDRAGDPVVTDARRAADSRSSGGAVLADGLDRIRDALGVPGEPGALPALIDRFEAAFAALAATPESVAEQTRTLDAALALQSGFNAASDTLGAMRNEAEAEIARLVAQANEALAGIEALNTEIRKQASRGDASNVLLDQRDMLLDTLAEILPIRTVAREGGTVSVFSRGGAILLDPRAEQLSFDARAVVSADLSLEDGTLSGLMLGTLDVTPGVGRDMLAGGALAAAFSLRDEALPRAQAELDALALGLSQRLQGADPTAPPGLFTDAGGPVDPAASVGLAGRLTLNAAVDPASGGALWRLRDGVGAAMPGPAGNPALPDAILSSLRQVLPPPAATPDATPRSLAGAGAALSAAWSARAEAAAQTAAYARAGAEALGVQDAEARGVDTDREMQSLLLIERAYQANAQVVRTLDDLMEDLIGMLR